MDQIAYYLDRIHAFLISDAKSQLFPSLAKAIEDILINIVKDTDILKQGQFDDCKSVAAQITAILEQNKQTYTLSYGFEINKQGQKELFYKKSPVAVFKEPIAQKPLRKPNVIQSGSNINELKATNMSTFKTTCLNATLKFVKNDAQNHLQYPNMTIEQADFIRHMIRRCMTPPAPTHNTDPALGFKELYDPLAEALKIFGLKYNFTLTDTVPELCGMVRLKFYKIPKPTKEQIDLTNTSSSSKSTDSYNCKYFLKKEEQQDIKDIINLDSNFKKNAMIQIKEFLTSNQDCLKFSNLNAFEGNFLNSWKTVINNAAVIRSFDVEGQKVVDEIRNLVDQVCGKFKVITIVQMISRDTIYRNVYFRKKWAMLIPQKAELICTESNQIPVNSTLITKVKAENTNDLTKNMPVNSTPVSQVKTHNTTKLTKNMLVNSTPVKVKTGSTNELTKNMPVNSTPGKEKTTELTKNTPVNSTPGKEKTTELTKNTPVNSTPGKEKTTELTKNTPVNSTPGKEKTTELTKNTPVNSTPGKEKTTELTKNTPVNSTPGKEKTTELTKNTPVNSTPGKEKTTELTKNTPVNSTPGKEKTTELTKNTPVNSTPGKEKTTELTKNTPVNSTPGKEKTTELTKNTPVNSTPGKEKTTELTKNMPVNSTPGKEKTGNTIELTKNTPVNSTPAKEKTTELTKNMPVNSTPGKEKTGNTIELTKNTPVNSTPAKEKTTELTKNMPVNSTPGKEKTGNTIELTKNMPVKLQPKLKVKTVAELNKISEDSISLSDTSFSSTSTEKSTKTTKLKNIQPLIQTINKLDGSFSRNAIMRLRDFLADEGNDCLVFSNVSSQEMQFLTHWQTVINRIEINRMFDLKGQMVLDEIRDAMDRASGKFKVRVTSEHVSHRSVKFMKTHIQKKVKKKTKAKNTMPVNSSPIDDVKTGFAEGLNSKSQVSSCSTQTDKATLKYQKTLSRFISKTKNLKDTWILTAVTQLKKFIQDESEASLVFPKITKPQIGFLTKWQKLFSIPEVIEAYHPDVQKVVKEVYQLLSLNASRFSVSCQRKKLGLNSDVVLIKNPCFPLMQPEATRKETATGPVKTIPKGNIYKAETPVTTKTTKPVLRHARPGTQNLRCSESLDNLYMTIGFDMDGNRAVTTKTTVPVLRSLTIGPQSIPKTASVSSLSKVESIVTKEKERPKSATNANASKSATTVNASKSATTVNASKSATTVNASKSDTNLNAPKSVTNVNARKSCINYKALPHAKAKLIEGLNQPVVSEKALRMMQGMGWDGGALGLRGEGIVEPIMLQLDTCKRAGLGTIKPPARQATLSVMTNLPADMTRVVLPHLPPKAELQTGLLQTILKMLVEKRPATEIRFPLKLTMKNWNFVKHLTNTFNNRSKITLGRSCLNMLCNDILEIMTASDYIITACWGVSKMNVLFVLSKSVYEPTDFNSKDWCSIVNFDKTVNKQRPAVNSAVSLCENVMVDGEPFRYYVLAQIFEFCQKNNVSIDKGPSKHRTEKEVHLKGRMAPKQMSYIKDLITRLNNKSRSSSDSENERSLFDEIKTKIQGFTLDVEFPLPKINENQPPVYKFIRLIKMFGTPKAQTTNTQNKPNTTGKAGKIDIISVESTNNKLSENKGGKTSNKNVQSLGSSAGIIDINENIKNAKEKATTKYETAKNAHNLNSKIIDKAALTLCLKSGNKNAQAAKTVETDTDKTTTPSNNKQNVLTDEHSTDVSMISDCICCLPDYEEDSRKEDIEIINGEKKIIDGECVDYIFIQKESIEILNSVAENDKPVVTLTDDKENDKAENNWQTLSESDEEEIVQTNTNASTSMTIEKENPVLLKPSNLNLKDCKSLASVDKANDKSENNWELLLSESDEEEIVQTNINASTSMTIEKENPVLLKPSNLNLKDCKSLASVDKENNKVGNNWQLISESNEEKIVQTNINGSTSMTIEKEDPVLLKIRNLNLKDCKSLASVDNHIQIAQNILKELAEQTSYDLLLKALKQIYPKDTNDGSQKEIDSSNENIEQNETRKERDLGKRLRSNAPTPDRKHKKFRYDEFVTKISITPKDYPQNKINNKMADEIQKSILKSIDYTQDLPLLKCYGIQDGALSYSCHSEKSLQFIQNVVKSADLQVTVDKETDEKRHKMALRINTFIDESVNTIFERLETFNMSINTKDWTVIKEERFSDFVVIYVEMDDSSYKFIHSEKYSLYAGIDVARFSVIWS